VSNWNAKWKLICIQKKKRRQTYQNAPFNGTSFVWKEGWNLGCIQNIDGWCTNGSSFGPCANHGGWQVFFFLFFSALTSIFVLELFFFLTPYPIFFPSKTFPPPAYSHLFIPLTPIHLFTYIFKIKIDFLPPTYPLAHLFIYLSTHIPTCMPFHLRTY